MVSYDLPHGGAEFCDRFVVFEGYDNLTEEHETVECGSRAHTTSLGTSC
jgi:hypothetical protein